jgi:hypothetical protein
MPGVPAPPSGRRFVSGQLPVRVRAGHSFCGKRSKLGEAKTQQADWAGLTSTRRPGIWGVSPALFSLGVGG